jgi:hypothetical protein
VSVVIAVGDSYSIPLAAPTNGRPIHRDVSLWSEAVADAFAYAGLIGLAPYERITARP